MIKLLETKSTYSIITEDKTYTLIQELIDEDEYIEVLFEGKVVDDQTWNEVVNLWEKLIETND
jgi:hypothetical protein